MEFHRRVQGDEAIQELGMDLQKLAHKTFPSMEGKDFDCMLKGRFYQALHPHWQRKLNAPKPDETFGQLFERARMLEQHEKQFTASAASCGETTAKKVRPAASVVDLPPVLRPETPSRPAPTQNFVMFAVNQGSAASRTSCVEVKETKAQEELTEEELEFLLACCRL